MEKLKPDEYEQGFVTMAKLEPKGLPEGAFIVGNKVMGVCNQCGRMVRLDKPIFGSMHLCGNLINE